MNKISDDKFSELLTNFLNTDAKLKSLVKEAKNTLEFQWIAPPAAWGFEEPCYFSPVDGRITQMTRELFKRIQNEVEKGLLQANTESHFEDFKGKILFDDSSQNIYSKMSIVSNIIKHIFNFKLNVNVSYKIINQNIIWDLKWERTNNFLYPKPVFSIHLNQSATQLKFFQDLLNHPFFSTTNRFNQILKLANSLNIGELKKVCNQKIIQINSNEKSNLLTADNNQNFIGLDFPFLNDAFLFEQLAFNVNGTTFQIYKVILAQIPYFQGIFSNPWKDNKEVNFSHFSIEVFQLFTQFLYTGELDETELKDTGKIEEKKLKDIDLIIELYKLSDYIELKSLKEICIQKLYQNIDHSNFIDIALAAHQFNDNNLKKLSEWSLQAYTSDQQFDFSSLKFVDILKMYEISKINKADNLTAGCFSAIKSRFALDSQFTFFCKYIKTNKSSELKECLIQLLKANPILYQQLEAHRKEHFIFQWKAYKQVMTDVTI